MPILYPRITTSSKPRTIVNDLNQFRAKIQQDSHLFSDTLAFIAQHYQYQPTAFSNGDVQNAAGENEGSCKLLGLAVLEGFSTQEALLAFGEHYRAVLAKPEAEDHRNIRTLMRQGLEAVHFVQPPLAPKSNP